MNLNKGIHWRYKFCGPDPESSLIKVRITEFHRTQTSTVFWLKTGWLDWTVLNYWTGSYQNEPDRTRLIGLEPIGSILTRILDRIGSGLTIVELTIESTDPFELEPSKINKPTHGKCNDYLMHVRSLGCEWLSAIGPNWWMVGAHAMSP